MIVTDERVSRFVSDALQTSFVPPFTVMGTERGGRIVNGVLFNCFEGRDVHVTAVGKGWTRDFLRELGRYVYGTLGCERMTITTADERVAAYAVRLGGQFEGRLRRHFGPDRDGIIVGILRDEWRFRIDA